MKSGAAKTIAQFAKTCHGLTPESVRGFWPVIANNLASARSFTVAVLLLGVAGDVVNED
jgi:hypothetical protein